MRYFIAASDAAYEAFRACLDTANGFPSADTVATLPADAYRSVDGFPLVAVRDDLIGEECVLLVSEITEQRFFEKLPPPPTSP